VSRFLFVTLPLNGHAYAAAAVAGAVRERGHDVAWAGSETYLRPLIGTDVTVFPTGMRPYRGQRDRGAVALKSLWEGFVVPFARFTLPAVDRAVREYQPEVLVIDQHAVAGALVANRYGLRWASLAPQSMELTRPLRALPKVDGWVTDQLVRLWTEAGLPAGSYVDPRFSPYLVLAFTGHALAGNGFADHFALVGPALGARPDAGDFDRSRLLPDRRTVLVTMGTLANDLAADFYPRAMSALAPMEVQAVVVAQPEVLPDPPANVLVAPRVPVLDLMPTLDAVVCHGGLNTMCEALAHGVPVVVAPIKHDQPVNAAQVAAAGAGVRVHFGRCRPEQLRAALYAVLDDPAYRAAAAAIRASFTAAGGAGEAARRLAALAEAA